MPACCTQNLAPMIGCKIVGTKFLNFIFNAEGTTCSTVPDPFTVALFRKGLDMLVGPTSVPTATNIFCFPPRRAMDASSHQKSSSIDNGGMCLYYSSKRWHLVCLLVSLCCYAYVSRSQPGQKTQHEVHLSCGSNIRLVRRQTLGRRTTPKNPRGINLNGITETHV
jgi:hypothetical protein